METICLKPIRLTRSAYFRLLVKIRLRKTGWLYALLLVMGFFYLVKWSGEPLHMFITILCFGWPLFMLAWFYVWTGRKDNRNIYEERYFVLDEEKAVGTTPGGVRSEIPWSYVQRVVEVDGRYLLYISAGQMLILDKLAFPDKDSEARFLSWVNTYRSAK
ncbi:MAG: YcxB family protein [Flavobacteriales bacterium]